MSCNDKMGPGRLPEGDPLVSEGYTRFAYSMDGTEDITYGDDVWAISLGPLSEADAIAVLTPSNPVPFIITTKNPFIGYMRGPIKIGPAYAPGDYTMEVIFWAKPPCYLPPTFIANTVPVGRRIYTI